MVRTILCHPVTEAKVFSEYYNPSSICCIEGGLVVVGSRECTINIHRIDKSGCPREHVVQAVGSAVKVVHCASVDFLLTLENKVVEGRSPKSPSSLKLVRVYVNWTKLPDGEYLCTHKIGYSESSHHLANYADRFLTLDIPMRYTARDISCCQCTGNIAIATETRVSVFACKKLIQGGKVGKKESFALDFFPVIEIDPGIQLLSVSLSGPNVAFASSTEMRALELNFEISFDNKGFLAEEASLLEAEVFGNDVEDSSDKASVSSISTGSDVAIDNHFTVWDLGQGYGEQIFGTREEAFMDAGRRNTGSSMGSATVVAKESVITFRSIKKEVPYVDSSTCAKEILGPQVAIFGHPVKVSVHQGGVSSFVENDVKVSVNHTTLLYKRLETIGSPETVDGTRFHSLQWLPVFADGCGKPAMENLFSYPSDKVTVALGLFMSTQSDGYLYDTLFKTQLLSVYNYTAPCTQAKLTINSLYSITTTGLETYTVRLYSSAAQTCIDMVSEGLLRSHQFQRTETLIAAEVSYMKTEPTLDNAAPEVSEDVDLKIQEGYYGSFIERMQFEEKKKAESEAKEREEPLPSEAPSDRSNVDVEEYFVEMEDGKACQSPFPVYSIGTLLKPCPKTDVETCLIGVYQLRGLRFVECTRKHVILLVKAFDMKDRRTSSSMTRKVPWNVYILEKRDIESLAKYLIGLIDGSEFANPMVYNQLLSEALFMVYSGLSQDVPLSERISLSQFSAELCVRAGDFLSRCAEGYQYDMIVKYYSNARLSVSDVLVRHMERDEKENLGNRYGPGIVKYLNSYMLDKRGPPLTLSEDQTEHLLHIYAIVKPSSLTKIMRESNLKEIPTDKAVEMLERCRREPESFRYRISKQDLIVLVVLYLRLCNPGDAEHVLKSMKQDDVVQVCLKSPSTIITGENSLTPFGQLLQRRFPGLFTVVLKRFTDQDKLTLKHALELIGVSSKDIQSEMTFSPIACEFLESIVNVTGKTEEKEILAVAGDRNGHFGKFSCGCEGVHRDEKREADHLEALNVLLGQYRLSISRKIIQDFGKGTHRHFPKGNGLFGERFEWLDQLPPFLGEVPCPSGCVNRKVLPQTIALHDSTPRSSPAPLMLRSEERQDCSCCCCQNVLLKLQSLLSSKRHSKEVASMIHDAFDAYPIASLESTRLICMIRLRDTEQAADLLAKRHVSLILDFATDFIEGDEEQLQCVLTTIVTVMRNNDFELWNRDAYIDALKGIVGILARVLTPSKFLACLPKDGAVKFFLPYIRDCLQVHNARSLQQATLDSVRADLLSVISD